jgi:hypothetical protein
MWLRKARGSGVRSSTRQNASPAGGVDLIFVDIAEHHYSTGQSQNAAPTSAMKAPLSTSP